jgi:hypothetical protein
MAISAALGRANISNKNHREKRSEQVITAPFYCSMQPEKRYRQRLKHKHWLQYTN